MSIRKIVTNSFVAGAMALAIAGAVPTNADAAAAEKEKCFGVVKAGHNDCAAKDGSHSCMAQATVDADGGEFVALPKGACEKLVGGSLKPYEGTELPDNKEKEG